MAGITNLNEKWSSIIELAAQEQSIIGQVTSGLYAPDATGTKVVHMRSIGAPSVTTYNPAGADLTYSDLTDAVIDLDMNIYKEFHFKVEDIHAAQYNLSLDVPALAQAGNALAIEADKSAFALYGSAGTTIAGALGVVFEINSSNVEDYLFEAKETLDEKNAGADRVIVVPSWMTTKMVQAKLVVPSVDANGAYNDGFIGRVAGFTVYQSNQLAGAKSTGHYIMAFTRRAIPFASQIQSTETIRLQGKFATAYRGLYVYGVGIRHADEVVSIFGKPVANA